MTKKEIDLIDLIVYARAMITTVSMLMPLGTNRDNETKKWEEQLRKAKELLLLENNKPTI